MTHGIPHRVRWVTVRVSSAHSSMSHAYFKTGFEPALHACEGHCTTHNQRKVDIMGCEKEKLGESIDFESFESDKCDHISVEEAEAQEAQAEKVRAAEGE